MSRMRLAAGRPTGDFVRLGEETSDLLAVRAVRRRHFVSGRGLFKTPAELFGHVCC